MTKREATITDFNAALAESDLIGVCVVADKRMIEAGGRYGTIQNFAGLVAAMIVDAANNYGVPLDEVTDQINAAFTKGLEHFDVRRH